MRGYLYLVRNSYMVGLVWRFNAIFTVISNVFYIVVIYFLWKNIFAAQETLHGMTFPQTFLYLALASSLFTMFKNYVDWGISREITSGEIAVKLIKPLDYQMTSLAHAAGSMLSAFTLITFPTLLVLIFVFKVEFPVGINLLFFVLSAILAFLLSFMIDYVVGLTSFYTHSLWGISMSKEIIVLVLSGALVLLRFYPEALRNILGYLPFQAIFNTPVTLLTDPALNLSQMLGMVGIQAIWVIVILILSRLFYEQAIKVLTIAGG